MVDLSFGSTLIIRLILTRHFQGVANVDELQTLSQNIQQLGFGKSVAMLVAVDRIRRTWVLNKFTFDYLFFLISLIILIITISISNFFFFYLSDSNTLYFYFSDINFLFADFLFGSVRNFF